MASFPELIYCAGGNRRMAEIAIDAGYSYGAQLPDTIYYPPAFVDQDWKKPNRDRYMAELAKHRPRMATVLDLERNDQLDEVLSWTEEAAALVSGTVIIIPKAYGIIEQLPRRIGGREVRLGYSVPTKYGGTDVPIWEFAGWPVHLLGGSPQRQLALRMYLDVRSADGNAHKAAAVRFGTVWQDGQWIAGKYTGQRDGMYTAFERSCRNIMAAWRKESHTCQLSSW